MIFMPPRHGKSELVSRLFSAYYLYRYPHRWVGINSYAAELAYTFSRSARDNYRRSGGVLRDDAYAVRHWETSEGGGLWAAGVGGPITGKGFHLGIIDDPVKNAEEAGSETIRQRHKDWYASTFSTREEPGAAVVVIQTRWNEDDLSGHLLKREEDEPEYWHIVHFEAIKEEAPDYPETCTVEADYRDEGQALAPERYPIEKIKKIARRIGEYFFSALYQQRPRVRGGDMFKREWFDIVPAAPNSSRLCIRVRYWDKAGTKGGGSHTAGPMLSYIDGTLYIEDLVMGQWAAAEREMIILQTARATAAKYGLLQELSSGGILMRDPGHIIGVEQEPGSGGKESAENTVGRLSMNGFTAFTDRPTGDKVTRAEPFAAQCSIGNVKMVQAPWNERLLDILEGFPHGIKDPVDGLSGAFAAIIATLNNMEDDDEDEPQTVSISPY